MKKPPKNQQSEIKDKDQEIENLRSEIKRANIDINILKLLHESDRNLLRFAKENTEAHKSKIESLHNEIILLKANPERMKGGTTAYFGKLCIVN